MANAVSLCADEVHVSSSWGQRSHFRWSKQQTHRGRLRTLSGEPTDGSVSRGAVFSGQRTRLRIIVDKCWLFCTAVVLQQLYAILCRVVQWVVHWEWEGRRSAKTNDVRLPTFTCVCQVVNVKILLQPLLQKDKFIIGIDDEVVSFVLSWSCA